MTARLERAWRWFQADPWTALPELTWAAVERMQADLPPAGPSDVEVEVDLMFIELEHETE